jgi:hypothetical protein
MDADMEMGMDSKDTDMHMTRHMEIRAGMGAPKTRSGACKGGPLAQVRDTRTSGMCTRCGGELAHPPTRMCACADRCAHVLACTCDAITRMASDH